MVDENTKSEDSFDLQIFKFLNHSSNAIFYGILAVGAFVAAILNTTTLYDSEVLNWGLSTLLMFIMSSVAGLIWWRQVVNRQDYKAILKNLMGDETSDTATATAKAEKIMEAMRAYKPTVLERLRAVRLTLAMMATIYAVFISFAIGNAILDPEVKLFDTTNTFFFIIGLISLIGVIVLNIVITLKYRKDLVNETYISSSEE